MIEYICVLAVIVVIMGGALMLDWIEDYKEDD
jgi:hypothetical protein